MITIFEIFENLNKPEIGDFIIANKIPTNNNNIDNFLKYTIGKIYIIQKDIIAIRYDNIPEKLLTEFGKINNIPTKIFNIDYTTYAKTIKELEIKLKAKKYNI
jgi:hypothetical protein